LEQGRKKDERASSGRGGKNKRKEHKASRCRGTTQRSLVMGVGVGSIGGRTRYESTSKNSILDFEEKKLGVGDDVKHKRKSVLSGRGRSIGRRLKTRRHLSKLSPRGGSTEAVLRSKSLPAPGETRVNSLGKKQTTPINNRRKFVQCSRNPRRKTSGKGAAKINPGEKKGRGESNSFVNGRKRGVDRLGGRNRQNYSETQS